jgi:beta-glucanase (GH16 family)
MKNYFGRCLFTTIAILFLSSLLHAQTPPPIEGNWVAIPELSDEFNNGINTNKWNTNDPAWQGRFPSYFEPNNVSVEKGLLKLKSREVNDQDNPPDTSEGTYTHATAAFKSKNKVKYGYFEVKSKAVGSDFWNSFWLYDATDTDHTEIDVYEIVASYNYRFSTAHLFYAKPEYEGTDENHIREQKEFFNIPDLKEYHIYGLDWNKDAITWYVDGVEVFTAANKHWHQALYVILDAEVQLEWPGLPGSTEETYKIDYIRAWKNKN